MQRALSILILSALILGCGDARPPDVVLAAAEIPEVIDFNFDVRPILSDRCFKCHGPDNNTRVQGIRFDTPDGIRASRRHLPGRILSEDPEERMPPPESNLTLTAREKAILHRWVEQGAEYQSHWAFTPPTRPDLPTPLAVHAAGIGGVANPRAEWPSVDFDWFVLDTMRKQGLEPAPPADPETWLRRVSFTLTGLPPTLDDMDRFLADPSADARAAAVDRLMDSPAFGERMAVDWLDLARYADSHGYQDDGWRNMWPWRDWVISAFNRNMPYDEFVSWQLAGDLMPGATREQILATGFNRNHLQSQEGGIVLEEYRVDYVADRTDTFGKAFLGLTAECARCHDHKYDPISQEEYYGLFAFFNSVNEVGNIPYAGEASPTVLLTDSLTQAQVDELREAIAGLEEETDPANPAWDAPFGDWLAAQPEAKIERTGLIAHFPLEGFREADDLLRFDDRLERDGSGYFWGDRDKVPTIVPGVVDSAMVLRGDGWLDTGGQTRFNFERSDPFSIELWVRLDRPDAVGPLFGKSGGLFNGNRGYIAVINPDRTLTLGLYHVLPNDAIEVRTADSLRVGPWQRVTMTYDGSSRAEGIGVYRDGEAMATATVIDNLKQSILYTIDPFTKDSTNWGDSGNLRIGFTETNQPMLAGATVDEFRVYDRALTSGEVHLDGLAGEATPAGSSATTAGRAVAQQVAAPPAGASDSAPAPDAGAAPDAAEAELRAWFVTTQSERYRRLFDELTTLRARENRLLTHVPSVMVMADAPEGRETFLLQRGAYDQPAQPVSHGTPTAVLPYPEDAPKNRLGLAEWLFDEENPLTARVAANRLWQQVFGAGIVSTSGNFGSQGALPSHPELLDWLAVEFRESGWDVRHMLRLMVLSSTFAQSSSVGEAERGRDPANRWLARGPSRRLSAEMMRDQALAVSGLLVPTLGGPPVKPYQPDGLWAELATRNGTKYEQDSGDALHRRSMYTLWKRTVPPPMMITFDASERNLCAVDRQSTSTPLQALVLMNDPQFFEAARVLGERLLREGGASVESRVELGFRLLTGRHPDASELATLAGLAESESEAFRADPAAARSLLAIGSRPRDAGLSPAEAAAYAVVASTIMNFDGATTLR